MKAAPIRALTHHHVVIISLHSINRRNEGRPYQGIDTFCFIVWYVDTVISRNEGRPYQGIDTLYISRTIASSLSVEMKAAPIRALTLI